MNNPDDSLAPDTSKVSLDQRVIVPAFGLGRFAPFNWERVPHSTVNRLCETRLVPVALFTALAEQLEKAVQELGDTVPVIERLLTMRKPPADLPAGLARGLGSDRHLLLPGRVQVQPEISAVAR